MAYLGNGIYDLLDVIRASKNPQINYEGLYQDAPSNIATSNLLQAMQPQYEYRNSNYINNLIDKNAFDLSGNVPVDFNRQVDFKNYLNNQPLRSNYKSLARFEDFNPRVGIVNTGLPINNTNSITPINNTSLGFDTSYGVANEEDETDQQYIQEQEPKGIAKLFQFLSNLPTPMNLIRSIGENFGKGPTYSRFSPGGTFRGGIYNIGGVNTPIQLVNDFYNRTTGLNRFDRARNRFNQTRSLKDLFGASRTLSEFNNARKIAAAQKASGYTSNFMNRPASERNYTGPSGRDNTGGDRGAREAADSFSNRSGMGRTGY